MKKKGRRFSSTKAVKAKAREVIGSPRPVRREENSKKQSKEKHKSTINSLLAEE